MEGAKVLKDTTEISPTEEVDNDISLPMSGNSTLLSVKVPKELDQVIRARAKRTGMSVPQLVRAMLLFQFQPALVNLQFEKLKGATKQLEAVQTLASLEVPLGHYRNMLEELLEECDRARAVEARAKELKGLLEELEAKFREGMRIVLSSLLQEDTSGGEQLDQ